MEVIRNNYAKESYDYERYFMDEIDEATLKLLINRSSTLKKNQRRKSKSCRRIKSFKIGSGKYAKYYLNIRCSFDIETYTDQELELATMYIWQFCLNETVILGRTWKDFQKLLSMLKEVIQPSSNQRIICWIHNLNYEFSFMRYWLQIDDVNENFFKEERHPLFVTHDHFIIFRDSQAMTNSSLEKLAKDYTNTQKLADEDSRIDYSIPRNSKTELTELELEYCDNDVLILSEYAKYFNDEYLSKGKNPLTLTSALYSEVLDEFREFCVSNQLTETQMRYILQGYKCKDEEEYTELMNFVYRGGFVHGNILYTELEFSASDLPESYDITSSYPASALLAYFPSVWIYNKESEKISEADYRKLASEYCVIATFKFKGIKSRNHHSLESSSKCVTLKNEVLDNGRILSADEMAVLLTEVDFFNYDDMYTWESVEIVGLRYSERIKLVPWAVAPIIKYYEAKQKKKLLELPYAVEKSKVNIFYGLSVKKFSFEMTLYDNDSGWQQQPSNKGYFKQSYESVLYPYIGVYISAHSRRALVRVVAELERSGHPVLYCDTDSIKVLHADEVVHSIIKKYNDEVDAKIRKMCSDYDADYELMNDLGKYDQEYSEGIQRFKYLGAKRYLISYLKKGELHHNQTVAGLPKNILFNRRNKVVDDVILPAGPEDKALTIPEIYEEFSDEMVVEGCKLASKYLDQEFYIEVDGVQQYEKSCCALVSSDFTLNIDDSWLEFYMSYQATNKNLERRNW